MGEGTIGRWTEISVTTDQDAVDDLVALFGRYCKGGAVVEQMSPEIGEPASDEVMVKGFLPEADEETAQKLEIALLLLSRGSRVSEPQVRSLEPEDWSESWKAHFSPQHIGERTVIVPSWHQYEPRPDEVIIHLDPGMAFGTGLHATTRLCLRAIERELSPGDRVLDVGTGSGILSISAALQGAGAIEAIDIDPICVEVTRENIGRNGVEDRIKVALGTVGDEAPGGVPPHKGQGYDLLLINILAEVIIAMAPSLPATLRTGGRFVASGIIEAKADEVIAALQANGLMVERREDEGAWVALIGSRA